MLHLRAFHSLVNFATMSPYLGMALSSRAVAEGRCPYCGERAWFTVHDNSTGADWHYCTACGVTGHVVDLLAHRLRSTVDAVFGYLCSRGLPLSTESLAAYENYRQELNAYARVFAASQSAVLAPTGPQRSLMRKFKLLASSPMSSERWFAGPGQLFGVATIDLLKSYAIPVPQKQGSAPCVVVPFFLTPGQIHRLVVLTSDKLWDVFPCAGEDALLTPAFAGPQILPPSRRSDYVVTDLLTCLQLQTRHLSTDSRPLPLLSCYAAHTTTGFLPASWAPKRNCVLWARAFTVNDLLFLLFHDCRAVVGKPHRSGQDVTVADFRRYLAVHDPERICDDVVARSLPWEKCFRRWWRRTDDAVRIRFAEDCEQQSTEAASFVRKLSAIRPGLVTRRVTLTGGKPRTYLVRSHDVVREDGTTAYAFVPQIRYVVTDGARRILVGVASAFRRSVQFRVTASFDGYAYLTDSRKFLTRLQDTRLLAQAPAEDADRYVSDLLRLGVLLSDPQLLPAIKSAGWHKSAFRFRNCRIDKVPHRIVRTQQFPRNAPGPTYAAVTAPCRLADLRGEAEPTDVFWSFLLLLTAQASGFMTQLPRRGIRFDRRAASSLLPYLRAAGVRRTPKSGFWPHAWPYARRRNETVTGHPETYVAFGDDAYVAKTCFASVRGFAPHETPATWPASFPPVLAKALAAVANDPLRPDPDSWQEWTAYVADVLDRLGGDSAATTALRRCVVFTPPSA